MKPLEALRVPGRRARALIHISAPDPLRPRRHPDLIARPVVAHHDPHRVRSVVVVVARHLAIRLARIPSGRVVHRVVPVVVVIRSRPAPTPVLALQRGMCPVDARYPLPPTTAPRPCRLPPTPTAPRPSSDSTRVPRRPPRRSPSAFPRVGSIRSGSGRRAANRRVRLDPTDLRPLRQSLDRSLPAPHRHHVSDPEALVRQPPRFELPAKRPLRPFRSGRQPLEDVLPLLRLRRECRLPRAIRLILQHHEKILLGRRRAFRTDRVHLRVPVEQSRLGPAAARRARGEHERPTAAEARLQDPTATSSGGYSRAGRLSRHGVLDPGTKGPVAHNKKEGRAVARPSQVTELKSENRFSSDRCP